MFSSRISLLPLYLNPNVAVERLFMATAKSRRLRFDAFSCLLYSPHRHRWFSLKSHDDGAAVAGMVLVRMAFAPVLPKPVKLSPAKKKTSSGSAASSPMKGSESVSRGDAEGGR